MIIKTSSVRSSNCNPEFVSVIVSTFDASVPNAINSSSPAEFSSTLSRSNCAPAVLKNFNVSPCEILKSATVSFVDVLVN